ncbi:MAG: winged helix-turn-helix transcriptional regulator [Acidimicrobiales bacterium]
MDIPDSHRNCPVGHATALLGDRWSMLIVREALAGVDRYQDFKDRLGISDHTLTRRLTHLRDIDVLVRDADRRYHLTDAGEDLARVMAVLGDWSMRWLPVDRPLRTPSEPVIQAATEFGFDTRNRVRSE